MTMSWHSSAQEIVYTDASAFPLYGKVSEQTNTRYERLPSYLQGVSRPRVWELGTNSAGLFIRFRSNSTSIHVRWESMYDYAMTHMTDTGTKGLDLYTLVDGDWRHVCSAQPRGKKSEKFPPFFSFSADSCFALALLVFLVFSLFFFSGFSFVSFGYRFPLKGPSIHRTKGPPVS